MPSITRRLEFDAGHRVWKHESKCKYLHGHRYVAEVTVESHGLDSLGRVVDFGVVKELIGGWIDEHWDHNLLLNSNDPLAYKVAYGELFPAGTKQPFTFESVNPTAEVMAEYLFAIAEGLLQDRQELIVTRVRLYETPNCFAEYPDA